MESIIVERDKTLKFCAQHEKIYIYGAGTFGKRYYEFLSSANINIEAFIVSLPNREEYCGKKVYALQEAIKHVRTQDGVIPAFEHVDIQALKKNFIYEVPDLLDADHMAFLKLITEERFKVIINDLMLKFGRPLMADNHIKFKKIAVIRTDAIGDLVCTTPFIRELRRNYPESKITIIIRKQNGSVIEGCPYVDKILYYDAELISGEIYEQSEKYEMVKKRVEKFARNYFCDTQFDAVFLPRELMAGRNILDELLLAFESGAKFRVGHIVNTDGMKEYIYEKLKDLFSHISYTKEARHEVMYQLSMLEEIGCKIYDKKMELWVSKNAKENAKKFITQKEPMDGKIVVAIGLVASVPARTWETCNYIELFELLKRKYGDKYIFVILGGQDAEDAMYGYELSDGNVINLAGKTSLSETAAIISNCDIYVGSNTGLLHIASAYGKPSVTIYAELADGLDTDGDSPKKMGAWMTEGIALVPPAGLDGCCRVCRMNQSHCINQIRPEMVMSSIESIINK